MGYLLHFLDVYILPILIVAMFFLAIMMMSCYNLFEKANIKGYKALIPIYNLYLLVKIAQLPVFVIALLFVPFLNIFTFFFLSIRIGAQFDKSRIFQIGMCIFPIIFYPVLAFTNSNYKMGKDRTSYKQVSHAIDHSMSSVEEVVEEHTILEETPKINALGVIEEPVEDYLILEIDDDSTWQDNKRLSEVEATKKIVEVDLLRDDPLLSPDAPPIKTTDFSHYKVCKNCGAKLDGDVKKCFLCGKEIEEEEFIG